MSGYTYGEVGCARPGAKAPAGYDVHHRSVLLGGADVWERAKAAIDAWEMFSMGWVNLDVDGPPTPGGLAVVQARLGPFRLSNPCRVIECYDTASHFGFIYGTLAGHAMKGEERFSVHLTQEGVRYEILAYSRPASVLARLGRPIVRSLQYQFGTQSMAAMRNAVSQD